jgi:hypothetical protein
MEMQSNLSKGTHAFQAIWDGENGNKLRAIFAENFEFHNLDGRHEITDLKALRYRMAALRAAHPGAHLRLENGMTAGAHVVFEWSLREARPDGSRGARGRFRESDSYGSCMVRLSEDRIAELWELQGELAE